MEDTEEIEETSIESTETSQDAVVEEAIDVDDVEVGEEEEEISVPFAVIENVPIFPGCENARNIRHGCPPEDPSPNDRSAGPGHHGFCRCRYGGDRDAVALDLELVDDQGCREQRAVFGRRERHGDDRSRADAPLAGRRQSRRIV